MLCRGVCVVIGHGCGEKVQFKTCWAWHTWEHSGEVDQEGVGCTGLKLWRSLGWRWVQETLAGRQKVNPGNRMNKIIEGSRLNERRPRDETVCGDMGMTIVINLSFFYYILVKIQLCSHPNLYTHCLFACCSYPGSKCPSLSTIPHILSRPCSTWANITWKTLVWRILLKT